MQQQPLGTLGALGALVGSQGSLIMKVTQLLLVCSTSELQVPPAPAGDSVFIWTDLIHFFMLFTVGGGGGGGGGGSWWWW